jgi:putative ABC transport system permease protein
LSVAARHSPDLTARLLHSAIPVAFKLAIRNLLRHRRRSFIAVSSVTFGIASLIVASGFIEWMFIDFREATIESQYGHVQISRPGFHRFGTSAPFRYLLPPEAGAKIAHGVAHLRSLAPRLIFTGLVSRGEATVSFIGLGFDPARDLTDDRSLRILEGRKLLPASRNDVLLGRGLAALLGARVGANVVLLTNLPTGGINAIDARVAGIFASVSKAYDDSALLMPIASARTLLRVKGAHTWVMHLDDTRHTQAVAAGLREQLDPALFEVRTWDQLADFYTRSVALLTEQLHVLRIIVIAIIVLGIGNTMTMSVIERTGEIGTSMALGTRRGAVLGQVLVEGAMIGAIGTLAGLAVAFLVSAGIDGLHIEMPPPPSLTRGYTAHVWIDAALVLQAPIVAIATTTLASLYPAWRASRMVIVDALRHNR